jgi:precorrin-2/cobalt-factor-2 C20-methyltransferase
MRWSSMKQARNLPRVRAACRDRGGEDAWLVEKGTMPQRRITKLATMLPSR